MKAPFAKKRSKSASAIAVHTKAQKELQKLEAKLAKRGPDQATLDKLAALKNQRHCLVCHHFQSNPRFRTKQGHNCPGPCPSWKHCNSPKCRLDPSICLKGHEIERDAEKKRELEAIVAESKKTVESMVRISRFAQTLTLSVTECTTRACEA